MKFNLPNFFKKEYLFLYAIVAIGAFQRLLGVITNSFAFTYDVGRDMLAFWNIAFLHKIPLIGATTGLPGVFYGPWWYYLLSPFSLIFSGDPRGIALVMSLIGVLSIIFGFILGKKLGGNFLGLCFALLISVSPVLISYSSQIWNPKIAPLFVILILFVLRKIYSIDKKDKSKYYLLLGLLLAFNIDLEIVFGLLLSFGIILSVIFTVRKKISLKSILFFAFGGLVIFAPRIFFELRHQFLMTKSFIAYFSSGNSSKETAGVLNTIFSRLNVLFDQFNSTVAAENMIIGALVLLFTIISLVFLYKKADVLIKNFINTSVIVIFIFVLGTIFFNHDIWPHYLVGVPIFYILLLGISIFLLSKKLSNNLVPLLILLFIGLINLNPVSIIENLNKPIWEGDASVYRNQLAVIDYIYKQAQGKEFKYVVYTPPVYDYTYQYLFMWHGKKTYNYLPVNKSNLFYVILEPDFENPSRLTDWLKQREKDGRIIKSETVKGGIVVQTRVN